MAHARNAPSDSKRWLLCSGSLNLCKRLGLLDDTSSPAAREGTAAHSVREDCLELGLDPWDFLGTKVAVEGDVFEVDAEMCEALQPGIDRVRQFEGTLFVEKRVDITPWTGLDDYGRRQGGTLDAGIVGPDLIVIDDLKFGRGIPVEAVKNYQQVLYALGFYEQFAKFLTKATRFLIIIDQPRNAQGGGEWEVSLDELRAIGEWIKERAALTFDPDAPCTPSRDACLWCPASAHRGACPAYEQWSLSFFDVEMEDLDDFDELGAALMVPDVGGLTVERMRTIYEHRAMLKKFIARVEASVADAVRAGEGDQYGLKVVNGKRSRRKHKDEEASAEWLHDAGYEDDRIFVTKLKTPAMLDKVCGKGKFPKDLCEGGEPTPVIVPIADARLAIPATALMNQMVDDLDDFDE